MATASTTRKVSKEFFNMTIESIEADLRAASTAGMVIDAFVEKFVQVVPNRKVWNVYGWPECTGKLIGLCKTAKQHGLQNYDEVLKYSNVIMKASGNLPFINKNGKKIEAISPDFDLLKKGLWYMSVKLNIAEDMKDEIATLNMELWQKMVESAEARARVEKKASDQKAELEEELADCPF